jgi:hypothetical protein
VDVIERFKFPPADGEYTPEQRRRLDASLAESEKGPHYGPFKNGAEVAAFLKRGRRNAKATVRSSERSLRAPG